MMETTTIDPAATTIIPRHEVRDAEHVERLAADMTQRGWVGDPLVIICNGDRHDALCGVHRLAAAIKAEIEVPAVVVTPPTTDELDGNEDADEIIDAWYEMVNGNLDSYETAALMRQLADEYGQEDSIEAAEILERHAAEEE